MAINIIITITIMYVIRIMYTITLITDITVTVRLTVVMVGLTVAVVDTTGDNAIHVPATAGFSFATGAIQSSVARLSRYWNEIGRESVLCRREWDRWNP
jgi:hypothetical protein